jgi:hypothetical protein
MTSSVETCSPAWQTQEWWQRYVKMWSNNKEIVYFGNTWVCCNTEVWTENMTGLDTMCFEIILTSTVLENQKHTVASQCTQFQYQNWH